LPLAQMQQIILKQASFLLLLLNPNRCHLHRIHFNLDGTTPQFSNAAGSRTIANADNFPILNG
jgi:hypothetical protein